MKKIAIRISDEFQNHEALGFIQNYLIKQNLRHQILNTNVPLDFEDFQGYIAMLNSTDSENLQADIIHFYSTSKPIAAFNESAKQVAKHLKKMNPAIAVAADDPEITYLNKIGIETEICPVDDFITDRYTKILSSSLKLTDQQFDLKMQKGILNLCKELVEMC